ncbi:MAG: phage portal protein [Lachnospiraceae bacterium]|nr:phage portal protein [Lachnospiraceae bacterium]
MLTVDEIKLFIDEDDASVKKKHAREGERYYEADHDIRRYRLFYFNADGDIVEDKTRSNVKIPHPFFTELVDQATQYILSGEGPFVVSDDPDLQKELDNYFNYNDDFISELSDLITDCQTKGFAYMYALKGADDRIKFACADSLGVVEVEARFASDHKDHVLYWYIDRIDKDGNRIKKIMDWDDQQTFFYFQKDDGEIEKDMNEPLNPRPHVVYTIAGDRNTYCESFGFIPFFRLDNNKKQFNNLKPIKDLIDDYDIMASSLSNNLIDFDTPIHVVKGFEGDNLDELQQNLKTKKIVGVGEGGGLEVHTVDVPYQARQAKLDLDEKNIYRFGMGLNMSGLKDTSATTNMAIKAAYSLLDLRCKRLEVKVKRFLREIVKVVVDEINKANGTDYQAESVYFQFTHEIMSNEQENVQNEKTEAERKQVEINTLLSLYNVLGDETVICAICEVMDLDYDEIKDQLPEDGEKEVRQAEQALDRVVPEGGAADDEGTEGSAAGTSG